MSKQALILVLLFVVSITAGCQDITQEDSDVQESEEIVAEELDVQESEMLLTEDLGTISELFPDENLAEAIANELNSLIEETEITIQSVVTQSELGIIERLSATSTFQGDEPLLIRDLTGVEYLTNMTELVIVRHVSL